MTGSAVDGEDIVQEAMIKAINALPDVGPLDNPVGWLLFAPIMDKSEGNPFAAKLD
jgi:predicted RNA polymerase sigma factor